MNSGLAGMHKAWCNRQDASLVTFYFTGAADVAASGYTVSGQTVTSVTRTDEGDGTIQLNRNFNEILWVSLVAHSEGLSVVPVTLTASGGSGATVTFTVTDDTNSGAPIDPDSVRISVLALCRTSNYG